MAKKAEKDELFVDVTPEEEAPDSDVIETATCDICGKPLTDKESIARGRGATCEANSKDGEAQARRKAAIRDEVPEDYIPMKEASDLCRKMGIPVGRLVIACGGDGMVREPIDQDFWTIYVRRVRYLPKAVLARVPELLETGSDAPKPPKPKRKKAKAKPKKKAAAKEEEAEEAAPPKKKATPKQYEVVAANYGVEIGWIGTLKDLKAAFRKEHGFALKITRKTTKADGVHYVDSTNDQLVAKATG